MPLQEIAVIGGGAKGAALAAKAACIRSERLGDIRVVLFERKTVGAHWDGAHGYTDGEQPLCTPAERDLGFPYDTDSFGARVAELMQARFSWSSHLVRTDEYAGWVNRGRPPPTHSDFAAYIRDAVAAAEPGFIPENVVGLSRAGGLWEVTTEARPGGPRSLYKNFAGVVVTSPGPSRHSFALTDPRFLNGESFWRSLPMVEALAGDNADLPVLILGSGGTAAAIAAWLVQHGFRDRDIRLLTPRATLYSRAGNFFENKLFDDEDAWERLHPKERQAFTNRLTRSVVWASVGEILAGASGLTLWPGRAVDVVVGPDPGDGTPPPLIVQAMPAWPEDAALEEIEAALVIDAGGFDAWWFADLLGESLGNRVRSKAEDLKKGIQRDLSFDDREITGLHAPFVSSVAGPGFTSLMVLGRMADRILRPYVEASRAPSRSPHTRK